MACRSPCSYPVFLFLMLGFGRGKLLHKVLEMDVASTDHVTNKNFHSESHDSVIVPLPSGSLPQIMLLNYERILGNMHQALQRIMTQQWSNDTGPASYYTQFLEVCTSSLHRTMVRWQNSWFRDRLLASLRMTEALTAGIFSSSFIIAPHKPTSKPPPPTSDKQCETVFLQLYWLEPKQYNICRL